MIHTEQLGRRFGDLRAVDGLSLSIARGEVFGLLGPNGAGKTTTVRMLTALLSPSEGRAEVNGHDVARDADAVRGSVGLLTETPGLYRRLTALENLRFFGGLQGVADVDGQARRYLQLLDLWDRRDDLAGGFSKGMRQKLAIARALLHEPPVVFLDEPTAALDPTAAKVVRDFIGELKAQGRTIVLCSHNLFEAELLCDRIGILSQRLLAVDTAAGLRARLRGSRVTLTVREVDDAVYAALVAVPGVTQVARSASSLVATCDDIDARTPALVRAAVGAGAEVLAVAPEEISLEAVYFDVVGAGAGVAS